MLYLDKKAIIISLLPIFPLLDFFMFSDFPWITIISYVIICLVFGSWEWKCDYLVFFLICMTLCSILFSTIRNGYNSDQFEFFFCMFTFVILGSALGKNLKYYTKMLLKMTYIYFMVNLAIYVYRSIQYSFDFNRVRSGISIFGGNSAHFVFLMMLLILKKYGIQKKEYYIMLLMTVVNAIMFVSKGAILLTIGWILLDIINQKKTEIINWKVISITVCGILITKVFFGNKISDFLSYFIERFTIWGNLYKNTGSLMGTRGQIADFTVSYIKSHISILLLGNGPATFRNINPWRYSNTHNLVLDLTFDIGLVGVIIFFGICITIVLKNKNSIYFILCVLYATMEGVALFFIDSSSPIISGLTFLFIVMYYYDSKKQYIDESNKNKRLLKARNNCWRR